MPKYKSIIIDDDEISNMLLEISINDLKIDTDLDFYLNPEKALDKLSSIEDNQEKPDIIFIDINMPKLNGWDLIEKLKENNFFSSKPIYVAILSSSISMKDKQRSEQNPHINEFISKPISIMDLDGIYKKIGKTMSYLS